MNIKVTDKAQEMIKKQLKDQESENSFLRIYIKGFG
jgi:Fe-S cluster assembly iron-binding protein IscA